LEARRLDRGRHKTKEQRLTTPLDEVLKRLEHLERRMARLEAALATGRSSPPRASNAESFREPPVAAPTPAAAVMPDPRVVAPLPADSQVRAPVATTHPVTAETTKTPTDAPTVRLDAVPSASKTHDDNDPFPDLSLLDEKVEGKKGPAELLDVRAALEDYPRICTRIEQLWGSPECEAYLNNLVIDTRGNRKGFPPPMMEELLYLGRLARALVILGVGGDLWDTYDQIGDRR